MKNIKTHKEFINEVYNGMHPKSNLGVGKFLVNYYRGKNEPKSGTIYRIHTEGHSDYLAFEICHHDKNQMSRSISDYEIIGTEDFTGDENNDWCFEVVDEKFVSDLVQQIYLDDAIKFLAERPGSISGVDKDKHYEYYKNLPIKDIAHRYVLANGGPLEIQVSIYDGDTVIENVYDPFMDFPGDFGGNKPVKFD